MLYAQVGANGYSLDTPSTLGKQKERNQFSPEWDSNEFGESSKFLRQSPIK